VTVIVLAPARGMAVVRSPTVVKLMVLAPASRISVVRSLAVVTVMVLALASGIAVVRLDAVDAVTVAAPVSVMAVVRTAAPTTDSEAAPVSDVSDAAGRNPCNSGRNGWARPLRAIERIYYAIVMSRAPVAKLGAGSPLFTVLFGVIGPHTSRFPPDVASKIPKATMVPQLAEGVGKVIAAALSVAPSVALAAVQLASSGGRSTRA
jgi:hypothetical protein